MWSTISYKDFNGSKVTWFQSCKIPEKRQTTYYLSEIRDVLQRHVKFLGHPNNEF
jgi:hypothetical protein